MKTRCITINIKGLEFGWFEERCAALINGLKIYQPDIVCLQEATIRQDMPLYNQARVIADAIGLDNCVFSPYGNPAEMVTYEQGGIALLSRWRISDLRGRRLPCGHRGASDVRTALFATIQAPDGVVNVINTHLSWRQEEAETRVIQIGIILAELSRSPWKIKNAPIIMAGDLNAISTEASIQAAYHYLKDAYTERHFNEPGYTWSSRNPLTHEVNMPDRRIDYILCDHKANVLSCDVILDQVASHTFPSDHFGVLADLNWP